jgi:hypothetical protein
MAASRKDTARVVPTAMPELAAVQSFRAQFVQAAHSCHWLRADEDAQVIAKLETPELLPLTVAA